MVASRTILVLAAAVSQTLALPLDTLLHQLAKRVAPVYSVINVDGSNGSNPTASIQTVTTTVTVTVAPQLAAVQTVYVTGQAVTVTPNAAESTSWYDDGMWKTSYFTRVPVASPTAIAPIPIPSFAIPPAIENISVGSSAQIASVVPSPTP